MRLLRQPASRRGSLIVGLLWCVALLSVVVVGVLHSSRMETIVVKNFGDRTQAHYLALAGVEKARAVLYHDARERRRSATNHGRTVYDNASQFRDVQLGRGHFRVFRRGRSDEGGGIIFGVSDEESLLNVNTATDEQLRKLYGLTPEVAAAIIDWRDSDNAVSPGGAEEDYYLSLRPPYKPRNADIQTIRELLMVRGIDADLLLANDVRQNGLTDDLQDAMQSAMPDDGVGGVTVAGWASTLTVNSVDEAINAAGQDRVNIQTGDQSSLAAVKGFNNNIANAIVTYRNQNRLQGLGDLLDVTAPTNNAAGGGRGAAPGSKVIDQALLMDAADDLTAGDNARAPGLININTASLAVLQLLPNVSRELAQSIISSRASNGFFPNIAWLLKVDGMNQQIFKQISPLITARSETYRIRSEGQVDSSGARQRIEVIVHVGASEIETLAYREDL